MEVFVVICYGILIVMPILGLSLGMVRLLTPLVSGILSLLLMLLLKNWAFGFLFQWAVFQEEHILSRISYSTSASSLQKLDLLAEVSNNLHNSSNSTM